MKLSPLSIRLDLFEYGGEATCDQQTWEHDKEQAQFERTFGSRRPLRNPAAAAFQVDLRLLGTDCQPSSRNSSHRSGVDVSPRRSSVGRYASRGAVHGTKTGTRQVRALQNVLHIKANIAHFLLQLLFEDEGGKLHSSVDRQCLDGEGRRRL